MNVLFYATMKDGIGELLQQEVETVVPAENLDVFRTIESLYQRLRRPLYDLAVAVLLTASTKELLEMISIGDRLLDIRIILILPNRKKETISRGHALYPRYLNYADGDFKDVSLVLRKMLNAMESNNNYREEAEIEWQN